MTNEVTKPKRRRRRRRNRQPAVVQQRSAFLDPDGWFADIVSPSRGVTGQRVTHETAMGFSAYFAAIRAISEDVAKLPLKVYRRTEPMGKTPAPKHNVWKLLHDEANPMMSAYTFRETMMVHALGYKGGFARIDRDGADRPVALWPIDPRTVMIDQVGETLVYRVMLDNGGQVPIPDRNMLHIHGLGNDGLTGYAITQMARDALGAALGSQRYSGAFFSNGARPSGILEVPGAMKDVAFERLRKSFAEAHQGAINASKPLILEESIKWNPTGMSPEDSQMIETMQFHVEDVARLFRIPPHKIQHLLRSTFSNIESQAIEYVVDTLTPWFVRWEQEIHRKLFLPGEKGSLLAKHQTEALLRGDTAAQATFFREMNNIGVMSINEIRDKLELNPVPHGDERFINSASITLDAAINPPEPSPVVMPTQPAVEPEEDEDDDELRALNGVTDAHKTLLYHAFSRLVRVESEKITRKKRSDRYRSWCDEFITEHPAWVTNAIGSTVDAYVSALLGSMRGAEHVNGETIGFEATKHIVERHMTDVVLPLMSGTVVPDDYATRAAEMAIQFASDAVAEGCEVLCG